MLSQLCEILVNPDLMHTDSPNTRQNRYVFSCFIKESNGAANHRGVGRSFHRLGAAASTAQLPWVFQQVHGTDSNFSLFDLSKKTDEMNEIEVDEPQMQDPDSAMLCM